MKRANIPAARVASARRIGENHWRKILVIGATDRGKSTYCRFLARRLSDGGHR
jgi:polynucleotide 5'-hydroxyl-kinase GRC3/NOL9